jgi:cytosine/adenosine deaminase-related metal-dependent hydrolase
MLLAGTGCFVDMYFFEDTLAEAVKPMGVRAFLGETVIDENQIDAPEGSSKNGKAGLALAEEFIRKWQDDSLITPMVAPHAPNTNDPETLKQAAALARKYQVPLTLHAAEMDYETEYFRKNFGLSPIAFLDSLGILSQPLIAAHCINVDAEDMRILAGRGVSVAHCVGANAKAAKGVAPVKAMLEAGVKVALGTDGPASGNTLDMFTQMDLFAKIHKNANRDRSLFPAQDILKLVTCDAAKALGIGGLTGSIEAGKKADITLVETGSANMFPLHDLYSVLVYSAKAANVSAVFVNGRLLVQRGQLTGVSLRDLHAELEVAMTGFYKKIDKF